MARDTEPRMVIMAVMCFLLQSLPFGSSFGRTVNRVTNPAYRSFCTTSKRAVEVGNEDGITTSVTATDDEILSVSTVPIYRCEGLFAIEKPLDWTSNDCVSHIRGILERDGKNRGAPVANFRSRGNKSRKVKVGHGGTLDPLATGVLVIGVGKGTKELQDYLIGSKAYRARGEFGYETTTLDLDPKGNITRTGPVDHLTMDALKEILPQFTGTIMQVPPIFSAIKKEGKRLYKLGQKGVSADDIVIEPREVEILDLHIIESEDVKLPHFEISMECGGGTYVRSLIRDIGYKLDTVATTTVLERTKQARFTLEDCIKQEDWTGDKIYAEIEKWNRIREMEDDDHLSE